MKTMWMKIRRKTRSLWTRFKAWFYGVLVTLGLATGAVFAATAHFTITMPTLYTADPVTGIVAPYPLSDAAEVRIYCDGDTTPVWSMAAPITESVIEVDVILGFGSHDCTATVISTNSRDSEHSNVVTKDVTPTTASEAPVLQ